MVMWNMMRGLLLLAIVGAVGCGGKPPVDPNRPKVVPVTGVVTFKQSPLEDAVVVFHSGGKSPGATARTDAQGRFSLQTFSPADGAVPGSYHIMISKYESHGESAASDGDGDSSNETALAKSLIPTRYQDPKKSGLTAEVVDGGENHFTFELTD